MPIQFFHTFTWGVKAWHAAYRHILPLGELSEWTLLRSLGHGCKHMLTILRQYGDQAIITALSQKMPIHDHTLLTIRYRKQPIKDVRVHAPITWIKLGIPIYFIVHSEFITVQCKKILSRANNNEIKGFEFGSIKRALRPHLRRIIAG